MKISINQQIEEIATVQDNQRGYLGFKVQKKQMRQSEYTYRMDRLTAVEKTLRWVAQNEEEIRDYLKAKKERATSEVSVPADTLDG